MDHSKFLKFIFFPVIFFIWAQTAEANLLITEVQIAGETSNSDFIEIYNNSVSQQDISGFKLRKRTQSGAEYSVRVFPKGSIIEGSGYFLWANSTNDFSQKINANASSTQTLAKNNSIAFLDSDGNIIDALAWGDNLLNPFMEGEKFSINPEANQSLTRKFLSVCECYQNLNNNSADFILNTTPTPGQQNTVATPPPIDEPQETANNPQPDNQPIADNLLSPEPTQQLPLEQPSSESPQPNSEITSSSLLPPISTILPSGPPLSSILNTLRIENNSTSSESHESANKTKIISQISSKNQTILAQATLQQNPLTPESQPKISQNKIKNSNKTNQILILTGVILLALSSSLGLIFLIKKI